MLPILINVAASLAGNLIDSLAEKIKPQGPAADSDGTSPTTFAEAIAHVQAAKNAGLQCPAAIPISAVPLHSMNVESTTVGLTAINPG